MEGVYIFAVKFAVVAFIICMVLIIISFVFYGIVRLLIWLESVVDKRDKALEKELNEVERMGRDSREQNERRRH